MSDFKLSLDRSSRRLMALLLVLPMLMLIAGVYGGLMQTLFRAGIIQSDPFMGPDYYKGLTMHGVMNALVFTTFFAVAFGNALVPHALKKHLPLTWAWVGGIMMVVGSVLATWMIWVGEATVLYTFYPPLQANPLFYIGLVLLVVGSWISFFNWIPLYLSWRRENEGQKTPLAVVGMFTTFFVWLIASLAVAVEILFLILPWAMGWVDEINVMLARTLFWMFGHPLVYFWLLPAYVMFYTMMPRLAGGKLYSDMAGRLVFMMFIIFSMPVGTHHQYMDPAIGSQWKLVHGFFTFMVALPSLITAFTLAASLEHAGRQRGGSGYFGWIRPLPWFEKDRWLFSYLICGLIIFLLGGISGIINASYQMNTAVHNTAWIPGHFHLTVAGPTLLAFLGMSLYLLGQYGNKPVKMKGWALSVPYVWTVGVFIFSWGLMRGGLHGMPRRTNTGATYANPESALFRPEWVPYIDITVVGGVLMTLSIVIFAVVFFGTLFGKAREGEPVLVFPMSEAHHDEEVSWLRNFKPWMVVAIILVVLTYIPVILDVLEATTGGSPPFQQNNPMPMR